jgi:hypothetical protein
MYLDMQDAQAVHSRAEYPTDLPRSAWSFSRSKLEGPQAGFVSFSWYKVPTVWIF